MIESPAAHIAGLCGSCKQMSRVESSRGSAFAMCNLSRSDPSFPKYPALPVLSCRGYEKIDRWTSIPDDLHRGD